MSCPPSYDYRPAAFDPGGQRCAAPTFVEHRSRLTEGEMFFRSKDQGPETNFLQLEISTDLFVYFEGVLVETFPATSGAGSITALRSEVSNPTTGSKYIEMPVVMFDVFDTRAAEDDTAFGGVTPFAKTYMRGGSGPPTDDAGLAVIRTGPARSIIILATTEAANGSPVDPPWFRRVQQWDGFHWITHANITQGECPYEGVSLYQA